MLPACAKEYLTAAKYYCEVEVKVCDQINTVSMLSDFAQRKTNPKSEMMH